MNTKYIILLSVVFFLFGCGKKGEVKPPSEKVEVKLTEPTKAETIEFLNGAFIEAVRSDSNRDDRGEPVLHYIWENTRVDNSGRILIHLFNISGKFQSTPLTLESEAKISEVSFFIEDDKDDQRFQKMIVQPNTTTAIKQINKGIMASSDGKFTIDLLKNPNNVKIVKALNHLKEIINKESNKF